MQVLPRDIFKGPVEKVRVKDGQHVSYGYPLSNTVEFLRDIGYHRRVPWGHGLVSHLPMVSFGYEGCRALMILDGSLGGHSHVYSSEHGGEYVEFYLRELRKRQRRARLFVVHGSDPGKIKEKCVDHEEVEFVDLGLEHYFDQRDVVLLPSSREVVVFTKGGTKTTKIPR